MIRTFHLQRNVDHTGVTGTGIVAYGAVFPDDVTVVRWLGEHQSTVIWPSLEDALAIHGHDGSTQAIFHNDDPDDIRAAQVIARTWRRLAAEGVRAAPEEFAETIAADLTAEGLLR